MQQQWLTSLPIHGVISTAPLLRGVANDVYRINTTSGSYVLKHFRYDHPYGLDRAQEVAVQRQLAAHDLAPEVIYFDIAQGVMLQPFVESDDLAHSALGASERIQYLAEVSAHIHRLQIDVPVWSLRLRLRHYCEGLAKFDPDRARQFQKRLQPFKKLIEGFGAHPTFCHNDLAYHHVFVGEPPLVIDWEYAGMGDRNFDLASSMQVNQFDARQQLAFLNAYEAQAGIQVNRDVVQDWLGLVETISQLWYELHHNLQQQMR